MDVGTRDEAKQTSIEVFCCYARRDQRFLIELKKHLYPLQREGLITLWADVDIDAGMEWKKEIDRHLYTAQLILLLISPDFMASEYCYSIEMRRAIERHDRGEAEVIPVILRTTDNWQEAPFGKLQAVPQAANGVLKPIQKWGQNRDDAYASVVGGIRRAIKDLGTPSRKEGDRSSAVEPLAPRNKAPILRRYDDGAIREELPSLSVSNAEYEQLMSPPSAVIERNNSEVISTSLPPNPPRRFKMITRRRVLLGAAGLAILGGASCYLWIHPNPSSPVSSPFNVYTDAYARGNHYTPTGFMGDSNTIKLTESWRENPHSGTTCIRADYSGIATQNNYWAGVYWQDPPNNWGWTLWQTGHNLSKLSQLSFWVRGNTGNEQMQFFVGGISGFYGDSLQPAVYAQSGDANVITCTVSWQQITINLKGQDLTHIIGGFAWIASQADNPQGVTFYLDDIIFT
jgi:TIR domain